MSKRGDPSISRTGRASRGGPEAGCPKATADIGVVEALSIGIGGIIGGGFFATFGLAVVGARGSNVRVGNARKLGELLPYGVPRTGFPGFI